jgi:serine phosphatase RsbU (regulator of sigma subunit)
VLYKNLFRKLEKHLGTIERSEDLVDTLSAILATLVSDFEDDLGIVGGRIYVRDGGDYVLQTEYPPGRAPIGFRIPTSYAPMIEILERGFILKDTRDQGVDPEIERAIGVTLFAAISIGERGDQVIAFSLKNPSESEHVKYTLNTIRHVINIKMRQEHLESRVEEVREIQLSLLPKSPPTFPPFDLWAEMVPAEEVGGDLYDFITISPRRIGITVADSSGHGLPAALQARDAIIGLRMGVQEQLRITATIEKLNRVVNASALASKFISLFYGELEPNGLLVYTNAGHPPPIVMRHGSVLELDRGGAVLGPNPDALYDRGYVDLLPGSALLAYTDGIVEAEDPRGEAFGKERLLEILSERSFATARELVEEVFRRVRGFSRADTPRDDQTVVAVIRR